MSSDYKKWNELIFRKIFNEENANKAVSIYVDEDMIHGWAREMCLNTSNPDQSVRVFVDDCIKKLGGESSNIAKFCDQKCKYWKTSKFKETPEFIGMLALLVYSSGWGDDLAHSFYPRFWRLVGVQRTSPIPSIELLRDVWKALEQYSKNKEFNLGIYKYRTLAPSKVNVGTIVAQGVLTSSDCRVLCDIFFDEGADANVVYSNQHIQIWLTKHERKLSPRARRALSSPDNKEYLIERVREELEDWDGEPRPESEVIGKSRKFERRAFLCFNKAEDGTVYAAIRLDFTGKSEDAEILNFNDKSYIAHSNGDAISTPLEAIQQTSIDTDISPGSSLIKLQSPRDFQGHLGAIFRSNLTGNTYSYDLNNNNIRVFVDGMAFGLTGYIEVFGLKPGYKHLVLFKENEMPDNIKNWCNINSDQATDARRVVPTFFTENPLWKVCSIKANVKPCETNISCLQYEVKPLARLHGGLRLYRRGNIYLANIPPGIVVNSRHPVDCAIDDGAPFKFDLNILLNELKNKTGRVKILLKEQVDDGRESELNFTLQAGAEWSFDCPGSSSTISSAIISPPNKFKAFIGRLQAAHTNDFDEFEDVRACWSFIDGGFVMPCTTLTTIKSRLDTRMSGIRFKNFSVSRVGEWRLAINNAKLHPVFSTPKIQEVWNKFRKIANEI